MMSPEMRSAGLAKRRVALPQTLGPALGLASAHTPERAAEAAILRGVPRGVVVELAPAAAGAQTTVAALSLLQCQREGAPVAWVEAESGTAYPPDLAQLGLDLQALLWVRVPDAAGASAIPKAAELLLRTGAFGGLVLDVHPRRLPRGGAWLSRLAALVREHRARCVIVVSDASGRSGRGAEGQSAGSTGAGSTGAGSTSAGSTGGASLGPGIGLRLRARRRRVHPGRYQLVAEVLKNKTGRASAFDTAGLSGVPSLSGPAGMP